MKTCSFIYFWPNFDKSFLKNYFFNDYKYTDDYINADIVIICCFTIIDSTQFFFNGIY